MTIETIVQARTKNATALPVDAHALASLGAGKRPRLRVTINGHTYSARVGIMRGEHLIPLPAEARAAAGVAAGDHVHVELEPDADG